MCTWIEQHPKSLVDVAFLARAKKLTYPLPDYQNGMFFCSHYIAYSMSNSFIRGMLSCVGLRHQLIIDPGMTLAMTEQEVLSSNGIIQVIRCPS